MSINTALKRAKNKALAKVFTAAPSLAANWAEKLDADGGVIPWSKPEVPLNQATVAVITTGGVHLKNEPAFDMADEDGDASWRAIPTDTPVEQLEITHDYYNHSDARKDLNLVLPMERLAELEEEGVIGKLHHTAFSFMGHIDGGHVESLTSETAPEVAKMLKEANVDYALLVPA